MLVRHLSLRDFRNYETAELTLAAGANLFVGSNGQGKTNLVEAIGYLSTVGSHRVSTDGAMIRQGTESAIVLRMTPAKSLTRGLPIARCGGWRRRCGRSCG